METERFLKRGTLGTHVMVKPRYKIINLTLRLLSSVYPRSHKFDIAAFPLREFKRLSWGTVAVKAPPFRIIPALGSKFVDGHTFGVRSSPFFELSL